MSKKKEIKKLISGISKKDKDYKKAKKQLEREKKKYMQSKSVRSGMKKYPPIMGIKNFFCSVKREEHGLGKLFTTVKFTNYSGSTYTNIFDIGLEHDYYKFIKYGFDKVEIYLGVSGDEIYDRLIMHDIYKPEPLSGLDTMRFPTAKSKIVMNFKQFMNMLKMYYDADYQIGSMGYPKTDYLLLNIFYSIGIKVTSKTNNLYLIPSNEVQITLSPAYYNALFGAEMPFCDVPNKIINICDDYEEMYNMHHFIENHVAKGKKEKKDDKKRSKKEVKETTKKAR